MPDQETWRFINTFAPWLSAIGTLSAVAVALYLSRRDRRLRLEVSAGRRLIITQGVGEPQTYLAIKVVNVGHREAEVTSIGWRVGLFRRQCAIQSIMSDGISSTLPVRLKDGEEANYFLPLNEDAKWLNIFVRDFLLLHPKLWVWTIRIRARTSVGPMFESKIEKGLRDFLLKEVRRQHNS